MHYPSYRPVLSFLTGFFIATALIGYGVAQVFAVTASEAPTNVAVDQITASSMRLSWRDNSQGETVFRIERSANGTNYTEVGSLSSTSSNATGTTYTYSDSGMNSLTSNTKYWYRVRACNGNPTAYQRGKVYLATVAQGQCTGYGVASPKYTLANPPASCSGIADNADPARINWTWGSGGAQSGFYASDSAGNTGWVTRTYWNQTGLTCGTSYTLNVKARNGDLVQTSAVSCTASTLSCQTLPAPANMRHTGNGVGDIVWAWDAVSGATMYTAEKSNDGSTFTWAGDITGTSIQQTTDYNQSPLAPNAKYYFRVAAQNANSTSPYSLASAYTSIQSATGASFSGVGQTSFTVSPTGAISAPNPNTGSYTNYIRFELHNGSDTGCAQALLQDSGWKNTASHTFNSGLTANTTYKVCIQTRNGDGDTNAETGMYAVTTSGAYSSPELVCDNVQLMLWPSGTIVTSINEGEQANVVSTIRNAGGSSTGGTTFYTLTGADGVGTEEGYYGTLEPAQGMDVTTRPLAFTTPGSVILTGDVDTTNTIAEPNETNNTCTRTITVNEVTGQTLTCGNNSYNTTEYDYNQSSCQSTLGSSSWGLTSGSAGGTCWNGMCCGDDSSENTSYCYLETGSRNYLTIGPYCSSPTPQVACCPSGSYCVTRSSACIQGNTESSGLNAGGTDNIAYCDSSGGASGGSWRDCDVIAQGFYICSSSTCGNSLGVYAGESGVGEYPDKSTLGCCGDDANENNITSYCPGYSGGPKCCTSSSDKIDASGNCVASCPTGDTTPPSVSVSGAPGKWQNANSSASVACSDTGSGCSSSSYKLKAYASAVTCSKNYADYTLSSPQTVTSHTFYCASAKDNAGNAGYSSTAAEFKVDKTAPVVSNALAHCDSYTDTCATDNDATIYFTWSLSDSGGSGLSSCSAELNDTTPDESAGISGKDTDTGRKGSNAYYVQCKDAAGNSSSVISDGISIGVK